MPWFGRRKHDYHRGGRTDPIPDWLRGVEEQKATLASARNKRLADYAAYCADFEARWRVLVLQMFKEVRPVLKRHRQVGTIVHPRKGRPDMENQYAWSLSTPTVQSDEWPTEHGPLLLELRLVLSDTGERLVEIKGDVRDEHRPYEAPIHIISFEEFSREHLQQAFREIVEFWLHPDVH